MVIDHGVINAQIENILEHYDKTIIDPNMKIYLETLYKHKSDIKMKDIEYSLKDNVLLLKSSAFEIKLDMNFDVVVKTRANDNHILDIICKYPTLKYDFNDAYIANLEKEIGSVMLKHFETMLGDFQYLLNSNVSNIKRDMNNPDLVYTRAFFEADGKNIKHIYSFINDLNIAAQSSIKMNKDLFSELTLFGLNFTPYILEIQ